MNYQTNLNMWVTPLEEPHIDYQIDLIGNSWVISIDVALGDTQVYLVVDDQGTLEDYLNG